MRNRHILAREFDKIEENIDKKKIEGGGGALKFSHPQNGKEKALITSPTTDRPTVIYSMTCRWRSLVCVPTIEGRDFPFLFFFFYIFWMRREGRGVCKLLSNELDRDPLFNWSTPKKGMISLLINFDKDTLLTVMIPRGMPLIIYVAVRLSLN